MTTPNEQEKERSNKLIADFMNDYKLDHNGKKWYKNQYDPELFEFNKSWDWLMPVVEKIEDIQQIGAQAYINISAFEINAYCSGHTEKELSVLSFKNNGKYFTGSKKIDAVYEAVVKFIEWYNSGTSTPSFGQTELIKS